MKDMSIELAMIAGVVSGLVAMVIAEVRYCWRHRHDRRNYQRRMRLEQESEQ